LLGLLKLIQKSATVGWPVKFFRGEINWALHDWQVIWLPSNRPVGLRQLSGWPPENMLLVQTCMQVYVIHLSKNTATH
jgi:hypothetical protein